MASTDGTPSPSRCHAQTESRLSEIESRNRAEEVRNEQTAALYARVSTLRQEEEATIASQVAAIEEYATTRVRLAKRTCIFLDGAVSGAKLIVRRWIGYETEKVKAVTRW
ncbi:recombinase family protein [Candidatus Amarolinea dominans]|uniref:recombinase family protein n=1 Tax=Candidatus Amarolinea dominans TaxID=3140696 RepID=UPI003135D4DC|nr:recombinase family protein [Anaerolineae bacterium]